MRPMTSDRLPPAEMHAMVLAVPGVAAVELLFNHEVHRITATIAVSFQDRASVCERVREAIASVVAAWVDVVVEVDEVGRIARGG